MSKRSAGVRARQVIGIVALCTAAAPSFADPVSLTAVCRLRSNQPGSSTCELAIQLSDNFASPGNARLAQVRVDSKLVAQFVNDLDNPVDFAIPLVSTSVDVACGVNHTVTASVAPLGDATAYARVGRLPAIRCPNAIP
jgi:hypothetical protein